MNTGGVDRLEVRCQPELRFTESFHREFQSLQRWMKRDRHGHYSGVLNLAELGVARGILFLGYTRRRSDPHGKFQLLDVAELSKKEIVSEIGSVYDADPGTLEIMRLDLYADVRDVNVLWFDQHAFAKNKRSVGRIGTHTRIDRTRRELRHGEKGWTLYLGGRNGGLKIYDKTEQRKYLLKRENRVAPAGMTQSFEERFRYVPDVVVTRVERSYASTKMPSQLYTLGLLFANAADFDPFDTLQFVSGGEKVVSDEGFSPMRYAAGLGVRQLIVQHGYQYVYRWWNSKSKNNAKRDLQRFEKFFPPDPKSELENPNLVRIYREGVVRQLAGDLGLKLLAAS